MKSVMKRRSPCGERGLKLLFCTLSFALEGRSPCGERGLKYGNIVEQRRFIQSLPLRGAWIEIHPSWNDVFGHVSLPLRGAWIEIGCWLRRP